MNHTNLPALFHAEAAKNSQSALRISVSSQEMDRKMIFRLKRKEKGDVVRKEDRQSQSTPPHHYSITRLHHDLYIHPISLFVNPFHDESQ